VERRKRWLAKHPLCVHCEWEGRVTLGTVLDHIVPLSQGGKDDDSNLQTLCDSHHDAKSKREHAESNRMAKSSWPSQRG